MSSDRNICVGNDRLDGIQSILDGKNCIIQGLEHLCEALKNVRCKKEFEAEINVVKGIHFIKEGLRKIRNGLCRLHGMIDREALKKIKEGVREICCALKELCGVLKDICCGRFCEAEEGLVKAIKRIKKGLCKIEKALDDICVC